MTWQAIGGDPEQIGDAGGPFDSPAYRRALVETVPGMTDLTWSARTPAGLTASVTLVGSRRGVEAVPPSGYGSLLTSGPLTAEAAVSFLSSARRGVGAYRLVIRAVGLPAAGPVDWSFARIIGRASAVEVGPERDPRAGFRRLAKRSVRQAEVAGALVRTTSNATEFLRLYSRAAADWGMTYPAPLLTRLGELGVARFDEVWLGDTAVAGLMTLRGSSHWMCWLAAQSPEGRAISASYLAYDRVFADASAVVPFVNLGASAPGTSGLEFKRRLGAREVPIYQWEATTRTGALLQLGSRLRGRLRRTVGRRAPRPARRAAGQAADD